MVTYRQDLTLLPGFQGASMGGAYSPDDGVTGGALSVDWGIMWSRVPIGEPGAGGNGVASSSSAYASSKYDTVINADGYAGDGGSDPLPSNVYHRLGWTPGGYGKVSRIGSPDAPMSQSGSWDSSGFDPTSFHGAPTAWGHATPVPIEYTQGPPNWDGESRTTVFPQMLGTGDQRPWVCVAGDAIPQAARNIKLCAKVAHNKLLDFQGAPIVAMDEGDRYALLPQAGTGEAVGKIHYEDDGSIKIDWPYWEAIKPPYGTLLESRMRLVNRLPVSPYSPINFGGHPLQPFYGLLQVVQYYDPIFNVTRRADQPRGTIDWGQGFDYYEGLTIWREYDIIFDNQARTKVTNFS